MDIVKKVIMKQRAQGLFQKKNKTKRNSGRSSGNNNSDGLLKLKPAIDIEQIAEGIGCMFDEIQCSDNYDMEPPKINQYDEVGNQDDNGMEQKRNNHYLHEVSPSLTPTHASGLDSNYCSVPKQPASLGYFGFSEDIKQGMSPLPKISTPEHNRKDRKISQQFNFKNTNSNEDDNEFYKNQFHSMLFQPDKLHFNDSKQKNIKRNCYWLMQDFFLFFYIMALIGFHFTQQGDYKQHHFKFVYKFWNTVLENCATPNDHLICYENQMVSWLIGYEMVSLLYVLKRVYIIFTWRFGQMDPQKTEALMWFYSVFVLGTSELVLQGYATTFFWPYFEIYDNNSNWRHAYFELLLIFYGYIMMIIYLFLIILFMTYIYHLVKNGFLLPDKKAVTQLEKYQKRRQSESMFLVDYETLQYEEYQESPNVNSSRQSSVHQRESNSTTNKSSRVTSRQPSETNQSFIQEGANHFNEDGYFTPSQDNQSIRICYPVFRGEQQKLVNKKKYCNFCMVYFQNYTYSTKLKIVKSKIENFTEQSELDEEVDFENKDELYRHREKFNYYHKQCIMIMCAHQDKLNLIYQILDQYENHQIYKEGLDEFNYNDNNSDHDGVEETVGQNEYFHHFEIGKKEVKSQILTMVEEIYDMAKNAKLKY